jgi:hypothetical protein
MLDGIAQSIGDRRPENPVPSPPIDHPKNEETEP